jgi:hypothetical protein
MRPARALSFILLSTSLWAADPFLGTWNLNSEKSKFVPGPAMKSMIMTWSSDSEKTIKIESAGVTASGKAMRESYEATYDGVERKKPGPWNFDAVINRQISENEREDIFKKNGAVVGSAKMVVSADGKVLTATWHFGELRDVRVLEKQ